MRIRYGMCIAFILLFSSIVRATTPQVISSSPVSGPSGTQVQINGSGFGATQGSSTVSFYGAVASVVSWSDTQIVATVPVTAVTGYIYVTVGGVSSNTSVFFNVPPPQITSISPSSGIIGTQVTVTGTGFQATKGANSAIYFNGVTGTVISWSNTQIIASVPANTTTGAIKVTVNSVASNQDQVFTVPNPLIAGITPSSGPVGTTVQISGSGFGATQGSSTLQFHFSSGSGNATVTSWSDSSITATVPSTATSGNVLVTVGGVTTSSNVQFTVPPPQVNSITPSLGNSGTQITVSGSGFQATKGTSALLINGFTVTTTSWSDTQIVGTVPSGTTTGPVRVSVNNVSSNQDILFTVPNPIVTSISPSSGPVGTQVTVNGSGFGATQGSSLLKFFGITANILSWSDTQITATVPPAAMTGYITVTVANVSSHAGDVYFTVPPAQVTGVSPSTGAPGAQVTVTGTGFRATQTQGSTNGNSSYIYFNGYNASVVSWSDTQIVATVPSIATTGPVTVVGIAGPSNADVVFTTANPIITSVSPSSAPVGSQVQINGSGFGATQGSNSIKFNSIPATSIVSWSDTQIVAVVPSAATSGAVSVVSGGITSNTNIFFTVPPPQISAITPSSGVIGTQFTISGSGFQATRGSSSVTINGVAQTIVSWSDTQIVASIASGTLTNGVMVTVNNVQSNHDLVFTLPNPLVAGINPQGGPVGTQVQISGTGFGSTQGTSTLKFNSLTASVVSWSDTLITATVPTGGATGWFYVTVGGVPSSTSFIVSNLYVNNFSPKGGTTGTVVTITGSGFGATQGTSTVTFGTPAAAVSSWSDTQIVATVPAGATTSPIRVTVGGSGSNSPINFNVASVVVSSLTPAAGMRGSQVQINGSGFGATQGTSSATINGWTATASAWSDTQITATVPVSASTGPVRVVVGGIGSNTNFNFNVINPVVTSVSPSSGPVGTQIQVTGSGFGATQGSSSLLVAGNTASIISWSDTSITATVPQAAYTGGVYVFNGSVYSNTNITFTVPVPLITSLVPSSGIVGTQVTINGTGFHSSQASNSVTFNGYTASVSSWSDTQIIATVPANARTGPVRVSLYGNPSNQDVVFTMPNPLVSSFSPTSGPMSTQVQINGSGFGATQGSSTVKFNNVVGTVVNWSDTLVTATVPATATSGVVAITNGGVTSTSTDVFNIPAPHISSITPGTGTAGTQITITGTGFHATQGSGSVVYSNNVSGSIVSWSDTQVVATVPVNAASGAISVWQNVYSNSDVGFVLINPRITGLVPSSGPVGTQVQINGSGFGATQGNSTVTFNSGIGSVVSWSNTQIVATVPANAQSGPVTVTVSGVISNNTSNFTVPAPRITGISPTTGTVGTSLTITGSGFQATKGSSYVYFNGTYTTSAISWSDTQIVVAVPPGAMTGSVSVQANNSQVSNKDFVFTMPNPIVSGLVPSSGPGGTQVQVNGTGFGATQGSSTVVFNGIAATVVSWSDTQVVAIAPLRGTSGIVRVIEGGVTSNTSVLFNVPAPTLATISPNIGGAGNTVTITGTGFQATQGGGSYVSFSGGGGSATIKSWSDTQIVAVVPGGTVTGFADVTINGISSNYADYIIPSLTVATLTPSTGPVGTQVTIAGASFGASQGTSVLSFSGQVASVTSWSDTQIVALVPVTAVTGPAVVTVNGINSNATSVFTIPPPYMSSYSPHGGVSGTQVTINGSGFQPNQRNSTVTFNGVPGTVTSWTDTQIIVNAAANATTGPIQVNVNTTSSSSGNVYEFPHPAITAVNPPEAPPGGTVTITGSGFGASPWYTPDGVSVVYIASPALNGTAIGYSSWSDTSITLQMPSTITSGNITVTRFSQTSNGMPITMEGLPTVSSLSPSSGVINSTVTINGSGFGSSQANSTVSFYSGAQAGITSWSDTQITAIVPPGAGTGPVNVTVAGVTGPTSDFRLNSSVQVTDSLGHTTAYNFEQTGGKWHFIRQSGSGCSSCEVTGVLVRTQGGSAAHDDVGHPTTTTDDLGRVTTMTWDSDHNLLSQSINLDANTPVTTSYTYNSFGEPLTVTDPLGNVTTNTYDANGNLLTVTAPVPSAGVAASVTQFSYDAKGQLTTFTDPLSHVTTLAYYPTGLIHTITDAQSNVTSYEYDLRGNRTAVVDALQSRTTFTYDAADRLTKITYADATFVSFGYDSRGRRTSVTDQNGHITSYAYDDADRLASVTDAAQNVTTYAYDTENDLLSITDAAGHITSFTYDELRRLTQTSFPSGLAESYVYDAVGNLTSKTDRKSQTINYVYDALNRLTHKGYPDATGVDYVYDLVGKIKQVTDPTGTYGLAYDNMGRVIGKTTQYAFLTGHTYSNSYTYDAGSNRTGFTAPDGSTNIYAYDTLNRPTNLTDSVTGQFTFGFDGLSRRTSLGRPNTVATTYGYNSLSRLLSVLHQTGSTTLDGASYNYDNVGNRTAKTNQLNGITEQYTYDPLYQLTQATEGAATTESYSYDAVGNRLSSQGMSLYAYNSSNQLTSTPAATFTYDNNGNTLTKAVSSGTTAYAWDFENRLTSVVLPGAGGTITFKYDPFGRRIQKSSSSGTINYLYDGTNSIEELDSAGALLARYTQNVDSDEPLAMIRGGVINLYEQDGLGSVTSLSDSSGALANTYTYDAFGNLTASTGTLVNPFQYTGRDYDTETGLRYYRARYYDPSSGRFLSEDPLRFKAGPNFYVYVFNSPLQWRDPDGKKPDYGFLWNSFNHASNQAAWLNCMVYGHYCTVTLQGTAEGIRGMSDDAILNTAIAAQESGHSSATLSNLNLRIGLCENPNCLQALEACARQASFGVHPLNPPTYFFEQWPTYAKWWYWAKSLFSSSK